MVVLIGVTLVSTLSHRTSFIQTSCRGSLEVAQAASISMATLKVMRPRHRRIGFVQDRNCMGVSWVRRIHHASAHPHRPERAVVHIISLPARLALMFSGRANNVARAAGRM
jgi:hypothetical protein